MSDLIHQLIAHCPGLAGHHFVRALGQGGMGTVYLLHDTRGADVAVKMMRFEHVDQNSRDRFVREISISAQLRHPHIVQMFSSGDCDGTLYYTMEFCGGGSLEALLRRRGGTLPLAEAAAVALQVLGGLGFAHQAVVKEVELADGTTRDSRGIVHRDLKPDNIFLTAAADGALMAKVADLGMAKAMDVAGLTAMTPDGVAAGTPTYQPRHQVRNFRHARPAVDVWAAAATVYRMLTGSTPRDFQRSRDPFLTILETEVVPIGRRGPSVAASVQALLDEALDDTQPELRFQSAGEFAGALREAVSAADV